MATQTFVPSFTDTWTASFENTILYKTGGKNTFYYDGKINIGFGYNLTAHHGAAARAALAAVGVTFTNPQWKLVQKYAATPSSASASALNTLLKTTITKLQALQLLDGFINSTVIPGLEKHVGNLTSLPSLTQTALENVYYDHSTLLGSVTYGDAAAGNLVGIAEQLAFNADNKISVAKRPASAGLEERFLADGALALGVIPTLNGSNVIASIDTSKAQNGDIPQFLQDILVGSNTLGGGGISAQAYVNTWGKGPATSYLNLTSDLVF